MWRSALGKCSLSIICVALVLLPVGCSNRSAVIGAVKTRLQAGDWAEYNIRSSAPNPLVANATIDVSGRRTVTVEKAANHGRDLPPGITNTYDVRESLWQCTVFSSEMTDVTTWLGEDGSGNVYLLGECFGGSKWDVVTDSDPPLYVPAKLGVGVAWSYVAHFASGNKESVTARCVSTESVNTPLGPANACKVSMSVMSSRLGVNMSGYSWLVPGWPPVFETGGQYAGHVLQGSSRLKTTLSYDLDKMSISD